MVNEVLNATPDETTSDAETSSVPSPTSSSPPVTAPAARAPAKSRKKRKPTYYVRKDETETLKTEVEMLRRQLEELDERKREEAFIQVFAKNAQLQMEVSENTRAMAGVHAMLSAYQASGAPFPLETFIHMPQDLEERRLALLALRDPKLRDGLEYILDRTGPLDLRCAHAKSEQSTTDDGNFIYSHVDVTVFRGVESVNQVYEAARHYFRYQEISVSEMLGVITIRENDYCEDEPVLQCRLLTTHPTGLQIESNVATFFRYYDQSDLLDSPHGVFVMESVHKDDLFPYQVEQRGRLRVASVLFIRETPGESSQPGTTDVTIVRSVYGGFHPPKSLPDDVDVEGVAKGFVGRFGGVMMEVIREQLYGPGGQGA
ncbi:hypothetical protein Poli38472_012370 [Pythium oligandrum]|uniref:START domain-containing protein n=1 Tax=Pythium oligandrum TaxID=41045 RepID=A0A8K1CPJ7_PYTOL|nr:hypothetical protein Poli38472_012370 [Pythium oligandrum]|eukprot:TMW67254.1 hypothetical protein Poli38472_012370 [Pythium oligandrum]